MLALARSAKAVNCDGYLKHRARQVQQLVMRRAGRALRLGTLISRAGPRTKIVKTIGASAMEASAGGERSGHHVPKSGVYKARFWTVSGGQNEARR